MAALAGELSLLEGSAQLQSNAGPVGYVQQKPWVMGGTVRDNILLGRPMDLERYWQVSTAHTACWAPRLQCGRGTELGWTGQWTWRSTGR